MEDHRVAHDEAPPEDSWPPPPTEEAADGPHRGGARRPPTTGMLPSGNADAQGPVVLLAQVGDRAARGEGYLRLALAVATVPGYPAPVLVCCSVASAIERALVLRPHLVVIGESFVPEWHDQQVALCRRLKQLASAETALTVVLLRDPRICEEMLPVATAAAVVSMLDRQAVLSSLRHGLYGC